MNILGISAFYHDSAACLVRDGEIIAAAQEERFTRKKHDAAFPKQALEYCLREGGIRLNEIDYVGFYDKPFIKFERLLETYISNAPKGFRSFVSAMPIWLKQKLLFMISNHGQPRILVTDGNHANRGELELTHQFHISGLSLALVGYRNVQFTDLWPWGWRTKAT